MTPDELRQWRDEAGLTQAGLASLLGVAMRTVRRWENNERAIPPFLALALAALDAGITQPTTHNVDV